MASAHGHLRGLGDNRLRVWNTTTGEQVMLAEGFFSVVRMVDWNPEGTRLVTVNVDITADDSNVRMWDANTGELLGVAYPDILLCFSRVDWSPDGSRIAALCGWSLFIWNATLDGFSTAFRSVSLPGGVQVHGAAWNPDSSLLALASSVSEVNHILIWDPSTETSVVVIELFTDSVSAVDWSPDGTFLASITGDGTEITIWDSRTGNQVQSLDSHAVHVTDIDWNPTTGDLASAGEDGTIIVWDITGEEITTILTKMGSLNAIEWSPDGSRLATANDEGLITIWSQN